MAFKTFGAETLLAADVNTYLMRQTVINVWDVTTRDAIPSPQSGMLVYVENLGLYYRRRAGVWSPVFGYTDWANVPLRAGFIGHGGMVPQWRINGNRVEFIGRVTQTGSVTGTGNRTWGDVPAIAAPAATCVGSVGTLDTHVTARAWVTGIREVLYQTVTSTQAVDLSGFSYPLN